MLQLVQKYSDIGHLETDTDNVKIQKSFLNFLALFMSAGGILWGSLSLSYDLIYQSMIPYGYVLISILNIAYFSASKNFRVVRGVQIFISLILPFMFQWSLGGFFLQD